jgi:NTE family protein
VLVGRGGAAHLPSTAPWREAFEFGACHHVRRGVSGDVRRVGRHLSGTSIGLVLGGGGARGMAHIGVLRALEELAIPVDHVGGSSMGAIVGAQAALGQRWGAILEANEQVWNRRSLRLDLTLPTVSVSSGRRAKRIFDQLFGDVELQDLPVPYFCTTTNLSRFALTVHRDGPAALWVRASASSPGLWPPVVDELGELHVDGGQLNNVPTDIMRVEHQGPIIAVDVCASQQPMTVEPGAEPPVGLRHLLRRGGDRFPSLVDTINRCALLASLQQREQAAAQADVYLTPDLSTVGFSGFSRLRQAVDIGYRTALDELSTTTMPGHHGS